MYPSSALILILTSLLPNCKHWDVYLKICKLYRSPLPKISQSNGLVIASLPHFVVACFLVDYIKFRNEQNSFYIQVMWFELLWRFHKTHERGWLTSWLFKSVSFWSLKGNLYNHRIFEVATQSILRKVINWIWVKLFSDHKGSF